MPQTAITDACICLDISHGRLLPHLAKLGLKFIIPDVIAKTELKRPPHEVFVAAGMSVETATGDEVAEVYRLRANYTKPSLGDLFALSMAKRENTILLSGDASLRKAAEKEGVEVRGILWLLDSLENHLPFDQLATALDAILAADAHLPQDECERRLRKWLGPDPKHEKAMEELKKWGTDPDSSSVK